MNRTSKLLLLPAFLFTFSADCYSQQVTDNNSSKPIPHVKSGDWTLFTKNPFVIIYYKYEDCHQLSQGSQEEDVFLKFVNLTDHTINFSWEKELQYDEHCYNCNENNPELRYTTSLGPHKSVAGICGDGRQELTIFSKFLFLPNKEVLYDFNIKNIKLIAQN